MSDAEYLAGMFDRLRAELEARSIVSSDVNSDHAREMRMCDDEIDRLRATIAALLAVPDDVLAERDDRLEKRRQSQSTFRPIYAGEGWGLAVASMRARMAAVVEGERNG